MQVVVGPCVRDWRRPSPLYVYVPQSRPQSSRSSGRGGRMNDTGAIVSGHRLRNSTTRGFRTHLNACATKSAPPRWEHP
jgi:hypothetical protein